MSGESPRILMVTAWSPAQEAGGVSTFIRTLCKELQATHSVKVLVNEWAARRMVHEHFKGLELYSIRLRLPPAGSPWLQGFLGWLYDFPVVLLQLRRLLKNERIDIVHLHFAADHQYYFPILKWLLGKPYVVTFHRGDVMNYGSLKSLSRYLVARVVYGADTVTAVSNWLAKEARQLFTRLDGVEVVHNGLDFEESADLESPKTDRGVLEALPKRFVVIVANVVHYKGQDLAIRAWERLKDADPDLHLVIVGEPREMWDECQRLIRELGCEDRVHMLGYQPREIALSIMRRAEILLFPSRSEGLAYVLLEAGWLKLPVICTAIPSFLEVVEDGKSAIVVPLEDPGAISEAAVRLAGDEGLRRRLAEALHERVRQDFSARVMASKYAAIYRRLAPSR